MRLLFCIALFLSAVWIGAQRCVEYKRKPRIIFVLADSISVLQNEVCVRRVPLPEALLHCSKSFGDTKLFYRMLYAGIQTGRPFSEVWHDAVLQFGLDSDDACQALFALGEQIGRYDAKTLEIAFAVSIASLRECASRISLSSKTNAKLAIGFGTVCGLLLAVVCY